MHGCIWYEFPFPPFSLTPYDRQSDGDLGMLYNIQIPHLFDNYFYKMLEMQPALIELIEHFAPETTVRIRSSVPPVLLVRLTVLDAKQSMQN